jgi:hypothetical protein
MYVGVDVDVDVDVPLLQQGESLQQMSAVLMF